MELKTFQELPTAQVARLVRQRGPIVCVFPINGTRRWFLLEYPHLADQDPLENYMRLTWRRQIELYKLFFDHGIDTLVTPVFGPDLLERGEEYNQIIEPGLVWLARDSELLDFYAEYQVRVRVYGDAQRYLQNTPYAHALQAFDELARRTAAHQRYRLFFGVCAHDAAETVAEIGVRFYQQHGRLPNKRQIIEAYYGEYVEPVSFFIGFERLTVFDMPLIATGNEDLYFTVSPSPYLDQWTLRAILYDHLYCRRVNESSYQALTPQDWQAIKEFYTLNRHQVIGIGRTHASGAFWYPLPYPIILPPGLAQE